MTGELTLGPGAEFDAVRAMLAEWGPTAVGIGDDAAVLQLARGDVLVASVDTAVEGRHFERGWLSAHDVGYRAVAAALSDLAAMAARPVGILVAMSVPDAWRASIVDIAGGIGDAVKRAGTTIRGGNLASGGELSITTTVLGVAFTVLSRAGARVGDRVYVTGRLGAPAAALELLRLGRSAGQFHDRFARPEPRLAEARWLAREGASAAIDISDGLVSDAGHLAAASGVCVSIDAARVPLVEGVSLEVGLGSGEEYELLVTTPDRFDSNEFANRFGIPLTEIGRVGDGHAGTVEVSGARVARHAGHDHFSG